MKSKVCSENEVGKTILLEAHKIRPPPPTVKGTTLPTTHNLGQPNNLFQKKEGVTNKN